MRILLISRCPPYPLYLGDRLIIYHLAEELEGRRHSIDLLAFTERAEDWAEQQHYAPYFDHVELIPAPGRGPLQYIKRALLPGARWPREAAQSWSPQMWEAIQRRLQAQTYDAIHVFGGVQVYEFFHALDGLPAIITPYESYSLYLRRLVEQNPRLVTRLQLWVARQFEAWMFAPYRRTVVVSERDEAELRGINPALPVTVIPNGVDTYHFRYRKHFIRRTAPALLFVGNYEYAPNVDAALLLAQEILPAVRRRIPAARLWLVGNAPPPEVRALESESIKVTGRVPDVRPYLARAAAFVCPLRVGAGIKNKVLEALAIGCPVVATPLSLDGIAVRDGHSALVAEADALAELTARLMQDIDLQRSLSENGRALIEQQYSWSRVAQMYEELYVAVQ